MNEEVELQIFDVFDDVFTFTPVGDPLYRRSEKR